MKKYLAIGASFLVLVVYFQNCSNVNIEKPPLVSTSKAPLEKIGARLCPSLSANGKLFSYAVKRAYVLNLTSLPVKGRLALDSDMDGIADADELNKGFDPANRRSFGVLDSVCLKTGGSGGCVPTAGCADVALAPGMTACDLSSYKSPNSLGRMTGLDSDNDSIPDLLELLRGTNIITADAEQDYDVDNQANLDEIAIGADLNSSAAMDVRDLVNFDIERSSEICNDRQNIFEISVNNIRLMENTLAVNDARPLQVGAQSIDLSHQAGENVLAVIYISEPESTTLVKNEMYMQILKVQPEVTSGEQIITASQFVFLGEIEP